MLVAIISIYWINGTTDVVQLYAIGIDEKYQNLLWLAFFSSFAVKTPMWPVHTWLPDAHVEAPTAGSVLLAAILLKMAGYGFIRFSLGLFPIASEVFTPLIYALSVIAIIFTFLGVSYSKNIIWLYALLLTFFSSLIISGYHVGIEKEIFKEFSGCTSDSINIIDKNELLKLLNSKVNSCKNVDFKFFGLSLATINFLLSFVILLLIFKVIKNEKNR